jgi:hypothetical protein
MLAGAGGGSRGMLGRLLTLKKRGLSGARERARVCVVRKESAAWVAIRKQWSKFDV